MTVLFQFCAVLLPNCGAIPHKTSPAAPSQDREPIVAVVSAQLRGLAAWPQCSKATRGVVNLTRFRMTSGTFPGSTSALAFLTFSRTERCAATIPRCLSGRGDHRGKPVYHIYGLLHSEDYGTRFADNLVKELPRIPAVKSAADFRTFSQTGRALGQLHVG
jgi:hypothetical protein